MNNSEYVIDRRANSLWFWREAVAGDAKRRWLGTLLFVAGGMASALVLQTILIRGLARAEEGNVGIMNHVMRGDIDAEVVISGSSRAMYHYDPEVIESVTGLRSFNIGRNGTRLHEQLHLLQLFLKNNRRPKYLIQNLDLTSLAPSDDITDPKQYMAWLDDEALYSPLVQLRRYYRVYRLLPLIGIAHSGGGPTAVMGLVGARGDTIKGFVPQYRSWTSEFDRVAEANPGGFRWTTDAAKVKTLEDMLATAKRERIELILVYSPDYTATRGFYRDRDESLATFKKIADKWSVPFWDYSDSSVSSDRRYFYNSQHLNVGGARTFTRLLADRLAAEFSQTAGRASFR